MWSFLMGKINNFTINLELTTETTEFLKASKCLYVLKTTQLGKQLKPLF